MTTFDEENFEGPEYWILSYVLDDGSSHEERGFLTLKSIMKRLCTLQIKHHPSTIEQVELSQIFDRAPLQEQLQKELDDLDQHFFSAMENSDE